MDLLLAPLVALQEKTAPTQQQLEQRHALEKEEGFLHSKQEGHHIVYEFPKEAQSVSEMFRYADVAGLLRLGTIRHSYDAAPTQSATAAGVQIGFETAAYRGFSAGMGMYAVQKIGFLMPEAQERMHPDYLDASYDSFAYLALAHLAYEAGGFWLEAGRIAVDLPYADPDDIRMSPNSFEGARARYTSGGWEFDALWLARMAGIDSEGSQDAFEALYTDGEGKSHALYGAGVTYRFNENDEASLRLYRADAMADIVYGDYAGHIVFSEDFHIEYGLQGALISESKASGVEGSVVGGMIILHGTHLFGGAAANYAAVGAGSTVTDGFGGGPYYTSLDEVTIAAVSELAPGRDVAALRLGIGSDFGMIGLEELVVEAVLGHMEARGSGIEGCETDLVVTYTLDDTLGAELIWTDIRDGELADGARFDRIQLRVDYRF